MKVPNSIKGLLFAPALIAILFLLKGFCPESAGDACFADYFATPIFLPLIALYKIFGSTDTVAAGHEFLFILVYWALMGFIVGFILDLYKGRSQYSPEQHPPL